MGLGEVFLALGTVDAAAITAWSMGTVTAVSPPLALAAAGVAILALLAVVAILPSLTVGAVTTAMAWTARRLGTFGRRSRGRLGGRGGGFTAFGGGRGLLPTMVRPARPMRTALLAPARTPDLDHLRFFSGLFAGCCFGRCFGSFDVLTIG